jgi:hypothetical protein
VGEVAVTEAYGAPPGAPHAGAPWEVFCASCREFAALAWPGYDTPPQCEFCKVLRPSPWRYTGKPGEARPTERELTEREAALQAEFYGRIERLIGKRDWAPGNKAGVRCPKCRREYRWGEGMALVHGGDCIDSVTTSENENPYLRLVK